MTQFITKLASFTTAFALALCALASSSVAYAATGDITITRPIAIDGSWVTDRHEPSQWSAGTVVIDGVLDGVQQTSTHERTEGRKVVLDGDASTVEIKLNIDSAWDNTAVRAGVWATSNANQPEWGIIEYTTAHGFAHEGDLASAKNVTFRVWDSNAPGAWTPVAVDAAGTVTLRIEMDSDKWRYYVNDTEVGTADLASGDSTAIKEVILNHYNYGVSTLLAGEADDGSFGNRSYTVNWSDLSATYSFDSLQEAVASAMSGDIIEINADITTDSAVRIEKDVTIEGNNQTLALNGVGASGTVSGLGLGDGVRVQNLVVVGSVADNLIETTGGDVTLRKVTVRGGLQAGITVLDDSKLTLEGTTTLEENSWGGINIKNVPTAKVVFAEDATLNYSPVSSGNYIDAPAVYVKDKDGVVIEAPEGFVTDNNSVLTTAVWIDSATRTPTTTPTNEVWWNKYVTPEPPVVEEENDSDNGGSGRSGGSRRAVNNDDNTDGEVAGTSTAPVGEVLGASTYNFTVDLTIGSTGADVNALQAMLIASGDLAIPAPTGYFGEMTKAALAKRQARHGVPATGYFGPLTRAAIAAAGTPSTMTDTERAALIAGLLEQVKELQEALDAMDGN